MYIIIVYFQCLYINKISIENRMERMVTLFAGLFYLVFICLMPGLNSVTPVLVGSIFALFLIDTLMKVYKLDNYQGNVLNIGVWTGVASLFYFPFIYLVIPGAIGLGILRSFRLVDFFRICVGIIVPYFIYLTALLLTDDLALFFSDLFNQQLTFYSLEFLLIPRNIAQICIFGLILLFSIISYGSITRKKNIQAVKKIDISFWFIFTMLFAFLTGPNVGMDHLIAVSLYLCIPFAMIFVNIKNVLLGEVLFILMLGLCVVLFYV